MKKILTCILAVLAAVLAAGLVSADPLISTFNPATPATANENSLFTMIITASAPDNGSTSLFSMVWTPTTPTGVSLINNSNTQATFTWTPGFEESTRASNKVYTITFTAADINSSDSKVYQLTVNNQNRAPTMTAASTTISSAASQTTVNLASLSSDPDSGDTLTYTAVSQSTSQITCSVSTSTLTIARVGNWTGTSKCTVTANDGLATAAADITVTVNPKTMLSVSDLKVTVDGKSKDINEDDIGSNMVIDEVEPGNDLKVRLVLKNENLEDTKIKIEDITVKGTLYEIDDGDDIDADDQDVSRISAGKKSDSIELLFKVPYLVDEGDYDLTVEVEAEDSDGNDQSFELDFTVEVEKDNDVVTISKTTLSPETLSCTRRASLEVEIVNTGSNDQDKAKIKVTNSALGIDLSQSDIVIDSGTSGDNEYIKTFDLIIPETIASGTYPIKIETFYDSTEESDSAAINLVVADCVTPAPTPTPTPPTPPVVLTNDTIVVPSYQEAFGEEEEAEEEATVTSEGMPFLQSTAFIVLMSVVGTLVIVGIISLLYLLVRKA